MTTHLENAGLAGLAVAGEGLMGAEVVEGVVPSPALLAEVLEAAHTSAEQGARVAVTGVADAVLEVRLNLDLGEERRVSGWLGEEG